MYISLSVAVHIPLYISEWLNVIGYCGYIGYNLPKPYWHTQCKQCHTASHCCAWSPQEHLLQLKPDEYYSTSMGWRDPCVLKFAFFFLLFQTGKTLNGWFSGFPSHSQKLLFWELPSAGLHLLLLLSASYILLPDSGTKAHWLLSDSGKVTDLSLTFQRKDSFGDVKI